MTRIRTSAVLAAGAMALAGCATVTNPSPADPIEGFNRSMYTFNDTLDKTVMTPVAKGYRFAVPQPARDMVTNFFSNVGDVYNFANNLLQLEVTAAAQDLMRLTINTFLGVGGLVDFATPAGLPKHSQDFGVTLGKWGLPDGPYLVLPVLGPSTVRDTVGMAGNMFIDPTSYINPNWVSYSIYGVRIVNTRANLLDASNLLEAAALDPYSFTRDAYLARRKYLINGGASGNAALPNYEEEDGTAGGTNAQPKPAEPASGVRAEPEAPQGSPVPGKIVPGGLPFRR
ncbi:MlaA family lipoprotein [Pandoraea terrigena]|uniref:Putative phospholipid-binding lipoprotein MlaA n=1 Tax=Pandoraea terrigena TaxID=2508292 RepID=A0A5E4W3J8_9BURK|nr:VacJ family lipoprotein [Pandoraea terrigena]VVE19208.1 putative phospholipid-binding lipoprotein MlaA [Pandoraea terrigena]